MTIEIPEVIRAERPDILTKDNIIYWSPTLRRLEGVKAGNVIKQKSLRFIELNLVKYSRDDQCWYLDPLPKNHQIHKVNSKGGHFECSCQFYNTVSKNWEHPTCSHIQAVKLWNEINNWNKGNKWDIEPRKPIFKNKEQLNNDNK